MVLQVVTDSSYDIYHLRFYSSKSFVSCVANLFHSAFIEICPLLYLLKVTYLTNTVMFVTHNNSTKFNEVIHIIYKTSDIDAV
jgi:hypothetical protein